MHHSVPGGGYPGKKGKITSPISLHVIVWAAQKGLLYSMWILAIPTCSEKVVGSAHFLVTSGFHKINPLETQSTGWLHGPGNPTHETRMNHFITFPTVSLVLASPLKLIPAFCRVKHTNYKFSVFIPYICNNVTEATNKVSRLIDKNWWGG